MITIPLHGTDDGVAFLPDGVSQEDWNKNSEYAKLLIDNYPYRAPDFLKKKKTGQKKDQEEE